MSGKNSAKDRLSKIMNLSKTNKQFETDFNPIPNGNGSNVTPNFEKPEGQFDVRDNFAPPSRNFDFDQNNNLFDMNDEKEEIEDSFDGFSEYNSPLYNSEDDDVPMKKMIEGNFGVNDNNEGNDSFDSMESSYEKKVKENMNEEIKSDSSVVNTAPARRKPGRKSNAELEREKEAKNNQSFLDKNEMGSTQTSINNDYYNKQESEQFMSNNENAINNDYTNTNFVFENIIKKIAVNLINEAKLTVTAPGFSKDDMDPVWDYILNKIQ